MNALTSAYVARISAATPLQLIIINYELIMHNLHVAKEDCEKEEYDEFERHIRKAQRYLMVLMESLDLTFEVAHELMNLYLYANRMMIKSMFKRQPELVCDACDMLGSLLDSWRMLERAQPKDAPVMDNVEQLIAGMTYRDGKLSEYVLGGENRGIMA